MRRSALAALSLAVCLLLTACAGTPISIVSDRERAASEVHADPAEAADLISHYRREHSLSAVQPDPILQRFAQAQADAMAKHDLLSHEVDGSLRQRLAAANLGKLTAVENVSAGYFSLDHVMDGWRRSPGHNANLLDPAVHRLGIATAYAPGTRYKVYWALVMSN